MQALLLGTGAGDIESPDQCPCANCATVRQRGGRSRRTYTSTLLDGELLLDCGPTVPGQLAVWAPQAHLRYLLVTHPDWDHFDPDAIATLAAQATSGRLVVCGSPAVIAALQARLPQVPADMWPIHGFAAMVLGPWSVRALPARHRGAAGDSLIYVISRNRESAATERASHARVGHATAFPVEPRHLLYATDTGPLLEATRAALQGTRLHAVIAEATFGPLTAGIPDLPSAHMNFPLLCELRNDLLQDGTIEAATPFVATHLSLHFCPPYEETAAWLAERGVQAGYDGMQLEW